MSQLACVRAPANTLLVVPVSRATVYLTQSILVPGPSPSILRAETVLLPDRSTSAEDSLAERTSISPTRNDKKFVFVCFYSICVV